jgi:RNA polymerase sigma-70 factor, ECF subfamily
MGSGGDITSLLQAWKGGDEAALERLVPLISAELHRLARAYMRRQQAGNTLQTTALLNEAFIRLMEANGANWADRSHFFAVAAQIMRRILVNRALARACVKRGGQAVRVNLDEIPDLSSSRDRELVALDEALGRLALFDARKARVIELRFFGGLSVDETAEVLKISPQSVMRDWRLARSWLMHELSSPTAM